MGQTSSAILLAFAIMLAVAVGWTTFNRAGDGQCPNASASSIDALFAPCISAHKQLPSRAG